MGGVEYQVTKVDPTDPETKGMVYQVHKVSEEVAATLGGKVYRARIIKDPTDPTVAGKVYQIVLIGDPDDPAVKGKVYNAILTGGSEAVVVGPAVSPLSLPDAIAGDLDYVKAFGGTTQNGTPTPTVPVDIVSNNGVLKARHQSGLPLSYTLLEYAESTGTQYIDLGYKGNGNTKAEVKFKYHTASSATGAGRVFGSRTTSSSNAFAIGSLSGVVSATGNKAFWCYDAQSYFVIDDPTFPIGDWQTVVFSATEHTLNGVSYGDDYNVVEFETPQNLKLFGFNNGGTMGYGQVDIAYCKLWDNGVLVRNLVPAKNSSNVIGMYDFISGQFFTNQGTGDFVAGTAVSDPVEIYTDGTVETIKLLYNHWDMTKASFTAPGFNIPSASVAQDGTFSIANTSGSSAARMQLTLSASALGLINGQKYTLKVFVLDGNAFNRSCYIYHGSSYHMYSCDGTQTTLVDSWTQNADDDVKVGFFYFKDYDAGTIVRLRVMVVAGETEPDTYQPYIENTATAEMLLKLFNKSGATIYAQDAQNVTTGEITRNVGVKVFVGTETWTMGTNQDVSNNRVFYTNIEDRKIQDTNMGLLCSHFNFKGTVGYATLATGEFCINQSIKSVCFDGNGITTVSDWKQWLADQYAAGTPVIVLYPLETPTTESVAGQPLQVQDGDNVLEITQASLNGLELEAEYEKEAE